MDIKIQNGKIISGTHPVIIIGSNGSGKTTFGSKLATANVAEWIPATRNLEFGAAIPVNIFILTFSQFLYPRLLLLCHRLLK